MAAASSAPGSPVNPFFAGRDALSECSLIERACFIASGACSQSSSHAVLPVASSKINYPDKYRYRIYAQLALAGL